MRQQEKEQEELLMAYVQTMRDTVRLHRAYMSSSQLPEVADVVASLLRDAEAREDTAREAFRNALDDELGA